jgi:hypothetical protein
VRLEPALERYGWYVDRRAFGSDVDLYVTGRSTPLTTRAGERVTAQEILERSWRAARPELADLVDEPDARLVEELVGGQRPLPCETEQAEWPVEESATAQRTWHDPYGSATRPRVRPVAEVAPVMLTWDIAVFVLLDRPRGRTAFAAVSGRELEAFLADLDAGRLDRPIGSFLRRRVRRSTLASGIDVGGAILFDQLGPRLGLVAAEYGPDGLPVAPLDHVLGRAA